MLSWHRPPRAMRDGFMPGLYWGCARWGDLHPVWWDRGWAWGWDPCQEHLGSRLALGPCWGCGVGSGLCGDGIRARNVLGPCQECPGAVPEGAGSVLAWEWDPCCESKRLGLGRGGISSRGAGSGLWGVGSGLCGAGSGCVGRICALWCMDGISTLCSSTYAVHGRDRCPAEQDPCVGVGAPVPTCPHTGLTAGWSGCSAW